MTERCKGCNEIGTLCWCKIRCINTHLHAVRIRAVEEILADLDLYQVIGNDGAVLSREDKWAIADKIAVRLDEYVARRELAAEADAKKSGMAKLTAMLERMALAMEPPHRGHFARRSVVDPQSPGETEETGCYLPPGLRWETDDEMSKRIKDSVSVDMVPV